MPRWTIQYVYLDDTGKTRVSLETLEAETVEDARTLAASQAPAEEFMITVHPQSEDQLLGSVRHQALIMAGKMRKEFTSTDDDDGPDGDLGA